MLKSALLFYRKLIVDLTDLGVTLNLYNPCVANKTVNSTQMTMRWHVNDLKILLISKSELQAIISHLKTIFRKPLT